MKKKTWRITALSILLVSLFVMHGVAASVTYSVPAGFQLTRDEDGETEFFKESSVGNTVLTETVYVFVENASETTIYPSVNSLSDAQLKAEMEYLVGDQRFIQGYEQTNPNARNTWIEPISENASRRTVNGISYYRYERSGYTHDDYYDSSKFKYVIYLSYVNGNKYVFLYEGWNCFDNETCMDNVVIPSVTYQKDATDGIKIYVNGQRVIPDSEPIIVSDRTMVPIRAVAEKLGYSVSWYDETKCVTLTSADNKTMIQFRIGDRTANRNNYTQISLDVPAMIQNSRTYLPLRAVAEAMDAEVSWDGGTRSVYITK